MGKTALRKMDGAKIRKANLAALKKHGFKVSPSLPTNRETKVLRPIREIALRLLALDAVFTWVTGSEKHAPRAQVRAYAKRSQLERWMTTTEKAIYRVDRDSVFDRYGGTIGWRVENMWSLAWVLGLEKAPPVTAKMMDQTAIGRLFTKACPKLSEGIDVVLDRAKPRSLDAVVRLEDLFYCAHNAVRSAQLGGKTVPRGFDPIVNGGVIHERRHALSWCLSPKTKWDDTDLST